MPFAATWMDVDTVILSEVNQRKTSIMMIAYMWNLGEQNGTSELTNRNRQTWKTLMVTKADGERIN